ncbi:hypothetical protein L9G16_11230 [Shewanella sp. A25]|nr:hypothetical protein [Shewanella shenzhenensis]
MVFMLLILSITSAWYLGLKAFNAGLSVRYWALLGLLLGPFALPLFTSQSRIALRKIRQFDAAIVHC